MDMDALVGHTQSQGTSSMQQQGQSSPLAPVRGGQLSGACTADEKMPSCNRPCTSFLAPGFFDTAQSIVAPVPSNVAEGRSRHRWNVKAWQVAVIPGCGVCVLTVLVKLLLGVRGISAMLMTLLPINGGARCELL